MPSFWTHLSEVKKWAVALTLEILLWLARITHAWIELTNFDKYSSHHHHHSLEWRSLAKSRLVQMFGPIATRVAPLKWSDKKRWDIQRQIWKIKDIFENVFLYPWWFWTDFEHYEIWIQAIERSTTFKSLVKLLNTNNWGIK